MTTGPGSAIRTIAAVAAALVISGCAAAPINLLQALPVVVSGAGSGIEYSMTNNAYKTFLRPLENVELAVHRTFALMEAAETGRKGRENYVVVRAETRGLWIYIKLTKLTPNATRMKVKVNKDIILKDKATASAIIIQVGRYLGENGVPEALLPPRGPLPPFGAPFSSAACISASMC